MALALDNVDRERVVSSATPYDSIVLWYAALDTRCGLHVRAGRPAVTVAEYRWTRASVPANCSSASRSAPDGSAARSPRTTAASPSPRSAATTAGLSREGEVRGYNTQIAYLPLLKAIVVIVNSDVSDAKVVNPAPAIFKALARFIAPDNVRSV